MGCNWPQWNQLWHQLDGQLQHMKWAASQSKPPHQIKICGRMPPWRAAARPVMRAIAKRSEALGGIAARVEAHSTLSMHSTMQLAAGKQLQRQLPPRYQSSSLPL